VLLKNQEITAKETRAGSGHFERYPFLTKRIGADKNLLLGRLKKISRTHLPGREMPADDLTAIRRPGTTIRTGGEINRT
jgi:hypothetical protein